VDVFDLVEFIENPSPAGMCTKNVVVRLRRLDRKPEHNLRRPQTTISGPVFLTSNSRRHFFAIVAIVGALLPNRCLAQSAASVAPVVAPGAANQITYELGDVYLPTSRVYVFVGKTGFGHEHGVVGQIKQGRINMEAARDAGSLDFDMASFAADTPDARKFVGLKGKTEESAQQQINKSMRGAEVLDVSRFPTASFKVRQVAKLPEPGQHNLPQYQFTGDFTLHGISRPMQIVAEAEEQKGWTHLRGSFTVLQSQFGIKPFKKALGAVGVTDQLTVSGDIWIARERQVASASSAQH
jgi:polyisoprenoid-binding protein YceI